MRSEREREAREARAQGRELAQQIRARADREKVVLVAEAENRAQTIRGQGDAEAIRIYAEAFGRDEDFFRFYRSMEAYRKALSDGETSMVLSPDSDFFRYFGDITGGAGAAAR
jgi:membrane protease subunit HflC